MKVLCVLYDDPKGGMPDSYALESLPKIEKLQRKISQGTQKRTQSGP